MKSFSGIDEVGRGCLVGPIIFCMVTTREESILEEVEEKLRTLGVKDSKEIKSPRTMATLDKEIRNLCHVEIAQATPAVIDYYVENLSLNELSLQLVTQLLSQLEASNVVVDSLGNSPRYEKELRDSFPQHQIQIIEKAERNSILCAAASICAKATRNEYIASLNREYPVGSGYPADPILKKFLFSNKASLSRKEFDFIRYSWGTVKRLTD